MINALLKKTTIELIIELSSGGASVNDIENHLNENFIFQKDIETGKPLYGYMGGKTRLAQQLIDLIPDHTVYCEPFFGSGALMFAKGYKQVSNSDNYREVINDLDGNIINFWQCLKDDKKVQQMIEFLDLIPYSNELTKQVNTNKDFYKQCNDIERACYWLYNILSSFGSRYNHGFAYGRLAGNNHSTYCAKILQLYSFHKRIQKTFIFNTTYSELIKKFDMFRGTMKDNTICNTFFYLDPPYIDTTKYNTQTENVFDYDEFTKNVKSINGYFMLSHYKSEWLLENFPQDKYFYVELEHTITIARNHRSGLEKTEREGKKANTEVVVMNYNPFSSDFIRYRHTDCDNTTEQIDNRQPDLFS